MSLSTPPSRRAAEPNTPTRKGGGPVLHRVPDAADELAVQRGEQLHGRRGDVIPVEDVSARDLEDEAFVDHPEQHRADPGLRPRPARSWTVASCIGVVVAASAARTGPSRLGTTVVIGSATSTRLSIYSVRSIASCALHRTPFDLSTDRCGQPERRSWTQRDGFETLQIGRICRFLDCRSPGRIGSWPSHPGGTVVVMARKLWTAAEMEKLSRAEQQAIFDESVVTDPELVPAEFLATVRADAERLIAARESQHTD